ncbi:unnamed protein product [Phaeothamnion confervicola]
MSGGGYGAGGYSAGRGGGYGGSVPGSRSGGASASGRIAETNRTMFEMENNRHINELSDQVSLLKELTIDIGNEVTSQNALLDGMGDSMYGASGLLTGTLRKINGMMARGSSRHMCYLIAFIVFTFVSLWWIIGHAKGRGAG